VNWKGVKIITHFVERLISQEERNEGDGGLPGDEKLTKGKSDSDNEVIATDEAGLGQLAVNDSAVAEKSKDEQEALATELVAQKEDPGEIYEVNTRLVSGIILGDALHNFADGIFIGAGFLLCDSSVAFSILASTIYHELAQELSDFFLLTQRAHLPPLKALGLNFLSGLSVTLGGIVILATDVSNYTIGVILSMSAGIYICISAKECMPVVDQLAVSTLDRLWALFFFALGAVPIGLVLLNHNHCEA
jgi:zinc transporter ZupT